MAKAKKKKKSDRKARKPLSRKGKAKRKKVAHKRGKPARRKSSLQKKTAVKKAAGQLPGYERVGKVTHYFPHVAAAVVVVGKGSLAAGDRILIKGHTTRFEQTVQSMQIDHTPISQAKKGDEIGLQVVQRVREHDAVYKAKR